MKSEYRSKIRKTCGSKDKFLQSYVIAQPGRAFYCFYPSIALFIILKVSGRLYLVHLFDKFI